MIDYYIDNFRVFPPHQRCLPLVHMTSTFENLTKIISEGFKPNYCKEYLTNDAELICAAFPMISLSNITADEAICYNRSYGQYGISLNKLWGEKNSFNPVLYLERQSDLTNEIINSFKDIKKVSRCYESCLHGDLTGLEHKLVKIAIKIFSYSKNYDGSLVRNNVLIDEKFSFGLEREWRKVVLKKDIPYFLTKERFNEIETFNNTICKYKCDFDLDEIDRIIVECDYQIEEIKELLLRKYNINSLPEGLIKINSMRHRPDEG